MTVSIVQANACLNYFSPTEYNMIPSCEMPSIISAHGCDDTDECGQCSVSNDLIT